MVIVKFRQNLFHYGFTEEHGLRTHTEFVAILSYGSHLAVIQIDDLPVPAHKSLLLLLHIFRINSRPDCFPFLSHFRMILSSRRLSKISAKVSNLFRYFIHLQALWPFLDTYSSDFRRGSRSISLPIAIDNLGLSCH